MPFDRKKYAAEWEAFSRRIRFDRARARCECEGVCGVNHWNSRCPNTNGGPAEISGNKVVLTVAHLDYKGGPCQCEKEGNGKCAIDGHVLALCQGCHLRLDIERHKFNARRTRARRGGQQWLGDMESRF